MIISLSSTRLPQELSVALGEVWLVTPKRWIEGIIPESLNLFSISRQNSAAWIWNSKRFFIRCNSFNEFKIKIEIEFKNSSLSIQWLRYSMRVFFQLKMCFLLNKREKNVLQFVWITINLNNFFIFLNKNLLEIE